MRKGLSRTISAAVVIVIGRRRCRAARTTSSRRRKRRSRRSGRGAEPDPAPQRSDPEPRRNGEGLRGARRGRSSRTSPTRAPSCWRRRRRRRPSRRRTSSPRRSPGCSSSSRTTRNLKANEQFNRLMDELVRHREPARRSRAMRYNERIQEYNTPAAEVPVERDRQDVRLQGISRTSRRPPTAQAGPQGRISSK